VARLPSAFRPSADRTHRDVLQAGLEVPAVARLLDPARGGRVLEVGCGQGNALEPLARLLGPARLVGLDVDRSALARSGSAPPGGAELIDGDVRAMPFADASFDAVVDFGTVYHVERPELALGEIARVLAPGGCFVHETRLAQLLAHPSRGWRPALPWHRVPTLRPDRQALLWARRLKRA
jgi:ubiquinone/menaquinone biosynthesis C-methylase UbiE